jgi:hypothetical protein
MGESDMNKLIAQIQKLCALGTPNITLTRSQVTRLLEYAEKTARKNKYKETSRLRLAIWRAEETLTSTLVSLKKERQNSEQRYIHGKD